jgi:hypothetical protein
MIPSFPYNSTHVHENLHNHARWIAGVGIIASLHDQKQISQRSTAGNVEGLSFVS